MTLSPEIRKKVALLVPRLGSDFEGEVVATARAITRTLTAVGQDLHDLADVIRPTHQHPHPSVPQYRTRPPAPPSASAGDWRTVYRWCSLYGFGPLPERDIEFLDGLAATNRRHLSPKQTIWLEDIMAKLRAGRRSA